MTRSVLRFPNLVESFPSDMAGILTAWEIVGSPFPTGADGQIFGEHDFPGSSGYKCTDVSTEYSGIRSVSVRLVIKPDYVGLDGAGRVTLCARGSGSLAIPGDTHPWGFGISVTGGSMDLLGYSQNPSTFVITEETIGTVAVPNDQTVPITLGFTRETVGQTAYWRASFNGILAGEVVQPIVIAFAVESNILSIAYRDGNGTPTEFYDGTIEGITVQESATTPSEEESEYQTRVEILAAYDKLPELITDELRDAAADENSIYHKSKIRPWAVALGEMTSRTIAQDRYAVANTFGTQLDYWIRSLGLETQVGNLTLAEKQATVAAVMADPGTFTAERLKEILAPLCGADVVDIDLYQNRNQFDPPDTASPSEPLTGVWIPVGLGTIDATVVGIRFDSKAGRNLSWDPVAHRALEARYAIQHYSYLTLSELNPDDGENAEFYGFGMAATLTSISGSFDSTQWTGFTISGRTSADIVDDGLRAVHIGVYGTAPDFTVATRTSSGSAGGASYTAWVPLMDMQVGQQLAVEYNVDARGTNAPEFFVRVFDTPFDPAVFEERTVALDFQMKIPVIKHVSITIQSEGNLSSDLFSLWSEPRVWYPRAGTGRDYFLSAPTATTKDAIGQTNIIRANERPVTQGHVAYTDTLEAGNPDGPIGYTRISDASNYPPALGDYKTMATHNMGITPYSLWTFQESGSPLLDRMNRDEWTAGGAGAAILYDQLGPDGRDCVFVSEDDTENYFQLGYPNSLDITPFSSVGFCMVYRWDSDNPTNDIVMQKQHSIGTKRLVLDITGGNFRLLGSDGVTTNSAQVGATSAAWDVLAFTIEDLGINSFRFTMANRTSSVTFTQAYASSLSINTPWEIGSSTGLMPARMRHRWLAGFVDSEASNLSGTDLEAVCTRVYGSIFGG